MADLDQASVFIVDLAKKVVAEMRDHYPTWRRAFVRFESDSSSSDVRSSYVTAEGVYLLDVMEHNQFLDQCDDLGRSIKTCVSDPEKPFFVMLIDIDADLNYEVHYEYVDRNRWMITKMNGQSGLPKGYDEK